MARKACDERTIEKMRKELVRVLQLDKTDYDKSRKAFEHYCRLCEEFENKYL